MMTFFILSAFNNNDVIPYVQEATTRWVFGRENEVCVRLCVC
jgi:hypothetical protein